MVERSKLIIEWVVGEMHNCRPVVEEISLVGEVICTRMAVEVSVPEVVGTCTRMVVEESVQVVVGTCTHMVEEELSPVVVETCTHMVVEVGMSTCMVL